MNWLGHLGKLLAFVFYGIFFVISRVYFVIKNVSTYCFYFVRDHKANIFIWTKRLLVVTAIGFIGWKVFDALALVWNWWFAVELGVRICSIAGVGLAIGSFLFFFGYQPPEYHGVVVSVMGKPLYSRGSGFGVIVPGLMNIANVVDLRIISIQFKGNFETNTKEIIPISGIITIYPDSKQLINYCTNERDIKTQLEQIIKHIVSDLIEDYGDWKEVMAALSGISAEIKNRFEEMESEKVVGGRKAKLQEFFGINLESVFISDPELPAEVAAAAAKHTAKMKEFETREAEMANTNKLREMEAKKIEDLARSMVSADPTGALTFQKAWDTLQVQFKIVPRKINELEIGDNAAKTVEAILSKFFKGNS